MILGGINTFVIMGKKISEDSIYVKKTMVDGTVKIVVIQGDIIKVAQFAGDDSLKEVEIFEGVSLIDNRAFEGCTSLVKVTLPSSVKIIRSNAFAGCQALEAVALTGVKLERIEHGSKWSTYDQLTAFDLTRGEELCLYYEGDYDLRYWD